MAKRTLLLAFMVLALFAPAFAHSAQVVAEFDARIFWLAAIAVAALLFIGVFFKKRLNTPHKKIIFACLVVIVLSFTAYLVGLTAYWNVLSESNGPVHWHADFEIEICGEKIILPRSTSLEGKVGTGLLHHHNDMRIHVEGIIIKLEEADLQHFFQAIGGDMTAASVSIPRALPPDSNPKTYKNGDFCPDGKAGTLKVFVNNEKMENFHRHIIAPYSKIPPGDKIKIIFDSGGDK